MSRVRRTIFRPPGFGTRGGEGALGAKTRFQPSEANAMKRSDATAIVLGLALGVPIGVMFDNIGMGIAIAFGAFSRSNR